MNYDIEAIKRKMLVKYPFFGSVITNVTFKENTDIPTAATDGEIIYYNPNFLESLSVDEQVFVFAHEVCHIAFNHILRSEGKDEELWNIATDAVINQFLKLDGLKIPDGGIDMAEAINYDAEQLYEKLLQEKQQSYQQKSDQDNNQSEPNNQSQEKSNDSQNQQSSSSSEDSQEDISKQNTGFDSHSMWGQAVNKHNEQQEKSNNNGNLLDKLLGKDKKKKNEIEKKQEELESMGERDAFKKNLEERRKQLEELKETISKQVVLVETSTNRDVRIVNDIGYAKPIVDWRYILREAIKYDVDWSYRNATIEEGVVSANLEEQPMSETEIVLDTSGSINEILLKNFLRECKNILRYTKLKVGCFDTEFYGFQEIRTEEDIENMQFVGGGGTNFNVAVGAFSRRVENKIIFTDGEAEMPDMPINAIWIVFGNENIKPNGGKVIYITPEQLQRLNFYKTDVVTRKRLK